MLRFACLPACPHTRVQARLVRAYATLRGAPSASPANIGHGRPPAPSAAVAWSAPLVAYEGVPFAETYEQACACGFVQTWRFWWGPQGSSVFVSGRPDVEQQQPISSLRAVCSNGTLLDVSACRCSPAPCPLRAVPARRCCCRVRQRDRWYAAQPKAALSPPRFTRGPLAHPPQAMPVPAAFGGFSGDVPNGVQFFGQGIDAVTRLFDQGGTIVDFLLREWREAG